MSDDEFSFTVENVVLTDNLRTLRDKCYEFQFECFDKDEYKLGDIVKNIDPDSNVFDKMSRTCKYVSQEKFVSDITTKDGIGIIHFNCRSIRANFESMRSCVESNSIEWDVIAISESWLNPNDDLEDFTINNYNIVSVSRTSKGGGVMLYVRQGYDFKYVDKVSFSIENVLECVTIELELPSGKNLFVVCCYRSPGTDLKVFNNNLSNILQVLRSKNLLLCGDFNVNLLNYDSCKGTKEYLDLLFAYGLYPLIDKPTRITNHSATLIDNIFTNVFSNSSNGIIITDEISDHLPVFSLIDYKGITTKSKPVYKLTRYVSPDNLTKIKHDLKDVNWSKVYDANSVDDAYNSMVDIVKGVLDRHCPVKTKLLGKSISCKPWLTKGLLKSIRRKNKLYYKFINNRTPVNEERYKQYKNRLLKVIECGKRMYYSDSLAKTRNDIKGTWSIINSVIKNNVTSPNTQDSFLSENNQVVSNPGDISNNFNKYFVNVGPNLSRKIPIVNNAYSPMDYMDSRNTNSMYINPTDNLEVLNIVKKFKSKTSTDLLDIDMCFVKNVIDDIINPFTYVCNFSLKEGIFPEKMKTAKVVPLYKSGSKKLFSNYRPISLLPQFSKILEKIFSKRLLSFIEKCKILCDSQYGFRKGRNTGHALCELVEEITDSIDNNEYTVGVFIDLKKAFDTINHSILLKKLEHMGIRGNALNWLTSYLNNRHQYVKYNNCNSNIFSITTGVPQGSILGPILFLLYINDLCNVSMLKSILFADDTNFFSSGKNITELINTFEDELVKIDIWFQINKLSLNVSKTNFMIFSRKKIPEDISLSINGTSITRVYKTKFLGVFIDCRLNWKSHIDYVNTKLSKCISVIYKVNNLLNFEALKMLYYTLFFPYMNYCVEIWGRAFKSSLTPVIVSQKRVLRTIFKVARTFSSEPLFSRIEVLRFESLVKYKISVMLFKATRLGLPNNLQKRFIIFKESKRKDRVFKVVYSRTTLKSQCISIYGPKLFNSLPSSIKLCVSYGQFKRCLKVYLL